MNIDKEYIQDAMKVLQTLVYSARPLRISEVAKMLAVDVDCEMRFDVERRLPEPRDILIICSSLVTTSSTRYKVSYTLDDADDTDDSDDGDYADNCTDLYESDYLEDSDDMDDKDDVDSLDGSDRIGDATEKLRLAHFSVKEYLTLDRIRVGPV
jgi:hypothetical protein